MTTMLRAIETHYQGYRFRSRLEARWAVFFDTLGLLWEYEPQGFALPTGPYLPDFWLPELAAWAEVRPTDEAFDWAVATALAEQSRREMIALIGTPDLKWYEMVHPTFEYETLSGRVDVVPAMHDWIDLGSSGGEYQQWFWGASSYPSGFSPTASMEDAVRAARSARFEFGEASR